MNSYIIGTLILIGSIALYLTAFLLNKKVEIPEECKIAMDDSICSKCPSSEGCITKIMKKDEKGELNV